jgi:hypothetical protein
MTEHRWPDDDPVLGVVKLGRERDMAALISEGHVYMNPAAYFAAADVDEVRRDDHEGASYCYQATGAVLQMKSTPVVATVDGPIVFTDDEARKANIYCLHARRRSACGEAFYLNQFGLGKSGVLLLDFDEFIRRVTVAALAVGRQVKHRLVQYVDPKTYHGPMDLFTKFSKHAH